METKQRRRKCKECKVLIPFEPRKVRCLDCYKQLKTNDKDPIKLFINEDE